LDLPNHAFDFVDFAAEIRKRGLIARIKSIQFHLDGSEEGAIDEDMGCKLHEINLNIRMLLLTFEIARSGRALILTNASQRSLCHRFANRSAIGNETVPRHRR
jgi:hypothetical protein